MAKHIRAASLYINGKKVATANRGKRSRKNNGTLETGDSGVVLGYAVGALISDLSFDHVVLFEGNPETQRFAESLDSGEAVKIQLGIIDGKIETGDYYVTGDDVEWDHKAGTMSGSFQLTGGSPRRT